jgi:hypothetical protein
MKLYLTLLIFFSFSTFSYAQITVSQTEFMQIFTAGSPLYVINGQSGSINIGNNSGPNNYDFTFVNMQNQIVLNNYGVSQIPELLTRYPSNATTFGESPQNIVQNPVILSSTDSSFFIGEATIENEYRFSHNNPYELFASFPLTSNSSPFNQYINVYDTTYSTNWQILATEQYIDSLSVSILGYGTLQLPDISLECLKMKREYSSGPSDQYKDIFFVTREGVLLVVNDILLSEPDTGYVNADYAVLLSSNFVGIEDEVINPSNYKLYQNFPNPFNPSTKITYTLPKSEKVKIDVFNLLGQKITTLLNKQMPSGSHEVEFTKNDLPSGVYLYRIEAGEYQQVRKMIIMK